MNLDIILGYIVVFIGLFLLACVVIVPIMLIWWLFKMGKIKRGLPKEMDSKLDNEKEDKKEVENVKEERREGRERDRAKRIREGGSGSIGESREFRGRDTSHESKRKLDRQGVQIPDTSPDGQAPSDPEQTIELHRPADL